MYVTNTINHLFSFRLKIVIMDEINARLHIKFKRKKLHKGINF